MVLKINNIKLRHWKEEDAKYLYRFAKNPNIGPIAGWLPHTSVEDSLNIIKTVYIRPECYAIIKEDIPIGCVELLIHPNGNHWWGEYSAEIGYWIAYEYQGKGYATEACKVLIKRAFEDLGIKQIFATYKPENHASSRVLEKLGFEYYTELNNIDYNGHAFREIAVKLEK